MLKFTFPCVVIAISSLWLSNALIQPDQDCGVSKACYPESCPPSGCADFFVSWVDAEDYLKFVMTYEVTAGDKWIALGFSKNGGMADASVVMCKSEAGTSSVELGYTPGYSYNSLMSNYGLRNTAVNTNGTTITCTFERIKNATQDEIQIFDLDQQLYLLHAFGDLTSGTPNYHAARYHSPTSINFVDRLNASISVPPSTSVSQGTPPTTIPELGDSILPDPECGVTKGCFSDCQNTGCSFLVTWRSIDDENIEFHISSEIPPGSDNWAAIGFSNDKLMGSDSVVACYTTGSTVLAETGYNTGTSFGTLTPVSSQTSVMSSYNTLGLSAVSGSMVNSVLHCNFNRLKNITGESSFYDLHQEWYLLFARGLVESGNLRKHRQTPMVSERTVDFLSTDLLSGQETKYLLVKIHGSLMILAWVLFSSIGIFVARYLKPMWPDSTLLGQKVWFQVHRICMVIVLLMTVTSFVIIFVEGDGYKAVQASDDNGFATTHPILGIVVTALTVMNPIMALFRCAPDHKRRPLFNFYHGLFGASGYIIAAITIIFGSYLDKSKLPRSATYLAIAYVSVFLFVNFMLEIYMAVRKRKGKIVEIELNDQQNDSSSEKNEPAAKQVNTPVVKLVFGFQIVSMLGFSLALIVLLVMS